MIDKKLPVLIRRNLVALPCKPIVLTITVSRPDAYAAVKASQDFSSIESEGMALQIPLVRDTETTDNIISNPADFIGTLVRLTRIEFNKDHDFNRRSVKVTIQAKQRIQLTSIQFDDARGCFMGEYKEMLTIDDCSDTDINHIRETLIEYYGQAVDIFQSLSRNIVILGRDGNTDFFDSYDFESLIDLLTSNLELSSESRYQILSTVSLKERAMIALEVIDKKLVEMQYELSLKRLIKNRVQAQMDQNQKEYYLNEQMKAINAELGNGEKEYSTLYDRIHSTPLSTEAKEKALKELSRLRSMSSSSSEATVTRTYIESILDLPWGKFTASKLSLEQAKAILDEDHYGMKKVKERILDFISVYNHVPNFKGPIICLMGPPGVGKTSIAKKIAQAAGRDFVKLSLGGVKDESEIRGHRRTFIGALPGSIMQKISKANASDPVFLLDEIDKISRDYRGDPSSCLLEVLDPQQNNAFRDHYLDIDYDLSKLMFITTANTYDIHPALLDRMEVIELEGYTELDKLVLAQKHIMPQVLVEHNITADQISLDQDALLDIIRYYTYESGVRKLRTLIEQLVRQTIKHLNAGEKHLHIRKDMLEDILGPHQYDFGKIEQEDEIGLVNGLCYTRSGQGDLLNIEAIKLTKGSGKIEITGNLGTVITESAHSAYTAVKRNLSESVLTELKKVDLHIHFPEAVAKDGPSAGVGIAIAIYSAITNKPVKRGIAMTGEITLHGKVLPIGGLREKLLAAMRAGVKTVFIPEQNQKDLKEISKEILDELEIICVSNLNQVMEKSFI